MLQADFYSAIQPSFFRTRNVQLSPDVVAEHFKALQHPTVPHRFWLPTVSRYPKIFGLKIILLPFVYFSLKCVGWYLNVGPLLYVRHTYLSSIAIHPVPTYKSYSYALPVTLQCAVRGLAYTASSRDPRSRYMPFKLVQCRYTPLRLKSLCRLGYFP